MGIFKDITGEKFGKLTVIKTIGQNKNKGYIWLCKCDCGREYIVNSSYSLTTGETEMCIYCSGVERGKSRSYNITNYRFGKLVGIKIKTKSTSGGNYIWECKCDCGTILNVNISYLKNGKKTMCETCRKKYNPPITTFRDITGKRFGKLVAISTCGKNKAGGYIWLCQCDCGATTKVTSGSLISGGSGSCGCQAESWLAAGLKNYFLEKYEAICEYKACINPDTGYILPYDIYLPSKQLFIEVQGNQHFYVAEWFYKQSGLNKEEYLKYQKRKDRIKKKYAETHGIYVSVEIRKMKNLEQAIRYIESFI